MHTLELALLFFLELDDHQFNCDFRENKPLGILSILFYCKSRTHIPNGVRDRWGFFQFL